MYVGREGAAVALAAAAAAQFQRESQDEPGAAHADRVAQGDGAAVDVDPSGGYAEIADRRQGDPGEVDTHTSSVSNRTSARCTTHYLPGCRQQYSAWDDCWCA